LQETSYRGCVGDGIIGFSSSDRENQLQRSSTPTMPRWLSNDNAVDMNDWDKLSGKHMVSEK
jgi:hypothetical protein